MNSCSQENTDVFTLKLEDIRPSQVYVSQEKLSSVSYALRCAGSCLLAPVPVVQLDKQWVLTDGHTRCLGLFLHGYTEVKVYRDPEEIDLLMYLQCLKWCREESVLSVKDLENRVIPHTVFENFWLQRCRVMNHLLHLNMGQCRQQLMNQNASENSSSTNSSSANSSSTNSES